MEIERKREFEIPEKEDTIDIKAKLLNYLSYWKLFIIYLLLFIVIAYMFNKYSTTKYKAEANILIKENKTSIFSNDIVQNNFFSNKDRILDEVEIIKSYPIVCKALKKLNYPVSYYIQAKKTKLFKELYKMAPFNVILDTSHFQNTQMPIYIRIISRDKYELSFTPPDKNVFLSFIAGKSNSDYYDLSFEKKTLFFGEPYITKYFSFKIFLNNNFDKVIDKERYYKIIVNDFKQQSEIYSLSIAASNPNSESNIIQVACVSNDELKVIEMVNTLADQYISSNLEDKNQKAINTIDFINSQLNEINDSLLSDETRLQNFRTSNNITDLSTESNIILNKLTTYDNDKNQALMKLRYYNYILDILQNNKEFKDIIAPSVMEIPEISLNNLVSELNKLYAEKSALSLTSTSKNPYNNALELQIQITKKTLLENIRNTINVTNLAIKSKEGDIEKVMGDIHKLPKTERDLIGLKRKFNINDQIYTFLLQKRAEAAISKASNMPDNQVINYAREAKIIYPNKKIPYLFALLLGFLLPILFIEIRNALNNTIKDKKDIEKITNIPVLGIIGHSNFNTDLVVTQYPKSILTESFKSLKANLQFFSPNSKSKLLVITSSIRGEGKSFFCANIASTFAVSNKKVIIIGCDLRLPKMQQIFNLSNEKGLTDYLIDKCSLDDIIIQTEIENLTVITSGPIPPNAIELIDNDKMKNLIELLRSKYDYIIIDTPPIGIVSDAIYLMKTADINIYIVRQNYTPSKTINYLNESLKTINISDFNIVINDFNLNMSKGNYGNRYGHGYYGYGYGYGYGYYNNDEDKKPKNLWGKAKYYMNIGWRKKEKSKT
ncbi:MAG: polysaccharide biosynthesis tyrosine autokinase [Bacteroidota bacterium]|nr:polysaccharide biosynthesis tyrosine autokinase [Bacteroidota bacterium]